MRKRLRIIRQGDRTEGGTFASVMRSMLDWLALRVRSVCGRLKYVYLLSTVALSSFAAEMRAVCKKKMKEQAKIRM